MRIAVCFLVYDKIECEDVWDMWLRGNEDKIRIYIHAKTEYTPITDFFEKNAVCIPTIPTQWGHSSLVRATLHLYREATLDPENTMFILVSGACIPVKSFNHIYSTLMRTNNVSYCADILRCSNMRYSKLIKKIQTIYPNLKDKQVVYKHHQWIILCRNHVDFVLSKYEEIMKLYNGIMYADESWFLTFLTIYDKEHEIIPEITTFTNWEEDLKGPHPKTYYEISDEELTRISKHKNFLFARKFSRTTPCLTIRLFR